MNNNVQISINAMQQRLIALETEILIKISQNENLEEEKTQLSQELERLKTENMQLVQKSEQAQSENKRLIQKSGQLETENKELKQEKEKLDVKNKGLIQEIKQLKSTQPIQPTESQPSELKPSTDK